MIDIVIFVVDEFTFACHDGHFLPKKTRELFAQIRIQNRLESAPRLPSPSQVPTRGIPNSNFFQTCCATWKRFLFMIIDHNFKTIIIENQSRRRSIRVRTQCTRNQSVGERGSSSTASALLLRVADVVGSECAWSCSRSCFVVDAAASTTSGAFAERCRLRLSSAFMTALPMKSTAQHARTTVERPQ